MVKFKGTTEYEVFENALKNLINKIDSDIIDIRIFAKKSTNHLEVDLGQKEKIDTKLI